MVLNSCRFHQCLHRRGQQFLLLHCLVSHWESLSVPEFVQRPSQQHWIGGGIGPFPCQSQFFTLGYVVNEGQGEVVFQKVVKLLANATAVAFVVEGISLAVKESFAAACCHGTTFVVFASQLAIRALQTMGVEMLAEEWQEVTDAV